MHYLPGWAVGSLGTAAIVAAFCAGGAFGASSSAALSAAAPSLAMAEPAAASGLEVSCEPGQRAVLRQASHAGAGAGSVSCVSEPAVAAPALAYTSARSAAGVIRVADTSARPYAGPAAIDERVEVYRPRSVPVSYSSREVARPTRTAKKSVVIIAGSTAAGAIVGGLANGKKGALIGGIVGGGAATVWDQVTRRRNDDVR